MSQLEKEAFSNPVHFRDKESTHKWVVNQGLKAALVWGTGGVAAHLVLLRYSPKWARVYTPYKAFILSMIPTAAFFTVTDRAAMYADRAHAMHKSISLPEQVYTRQLSLNEWIVKNKYSVLGYSWLTAMGASLAYNFGNKQIPMSQKLINSRMIAQTLTIGGMALLAFLAANQQVAKRDDQDDEDAKRRMRNPSKLHDEHYDRIVNPTK